MPPDQRRLEQELAALRLQSGRLRALLETAANPHLDPEEQAVIALEAGCRLLSMDRGAVLRVREDDAEFCTAVFAYPADGVVSAGDRLPLMRGSFHDAVRMNAPVAYHNIAGLPEAEGREDELAATGLRAFIGCPLYVNGALYGGLGLASLAPRPEPFPDADVAFVQLLGRWVELILERLEGDAARAALEDKFRETQRLQGLGLLAGGIAHDFNNLLTSIVASASLARRRLADPNRADAHVADVIVAAERAADLTRQMLAYAGRGTMETGPCALDALVGETVRLVTPAVSKDVAIDCELATDTPTIRADAAQLRQVVMNLLTNASDAIAGAGTVTVRTGVETAAAGGPDADIKVEDAPAGAYAFVEIADTGSGMSSETRARMFDPFFTTKRAGRGLGLAAVLGIVRGHRGAIRLRSAPGCGTTVRVLFPAAAEAAAELDTGAPVDALSGRVLLVDDEPSLRTAVAAALDDFGIAVVEAGDGDEALAALHREGQRLDAVVLDMTMPGRDGAATLRALRVQFPALHVVLMSGYARAGLPADLLSQPHVDFLQKPFLPEDLVRRLQPVLRRR